jgi:hypothetical protein
MSKEKCKNLATVKVFKSQKTFFRKELTPPPLDLFFASVSRSKEQKCAGMPTKKLFAYS